MNLVLLLKILSGLALGIGGLALLQRLRSGERRRLMVALTFIAGLFFLLEFVLPPGTTFFGLVPPADLTRDNFLSSWVEVIGNVVMVVGGFAFGLGLLNLATIHGRTLFRARAGWQNSLAFFVAMIAMTLAGLLKDHRAWVTVHDVLFQGLYQPLGASVFSILAFFITTAAYRAFRVRSGEATLMMIAAFIVMMAQVPIGMMMTNWLPTEGWAASLRIESISNWVLTVLNMAALRAVGFGIGVGWLAMSLRVWLSLEKGSYFGKEM
ncbi:MAG: hypothetical protein HY321_07805 [Armatimonadetes bacterium]|nr:hypothetical protein [Armatimonadota bacterium]